jgi:hypothetical protein
VTSIMHIGFKTSVNYELTLQKQIDVQVVSSAKDGKALQLNRIVFGVVPKQGQQILVMLNSKTQGLGCPIEAQRMKGQRKCKVSYSPNHIELRFVFHIWVCQKF